MTPNRPHILVVGGGYVGMYAALRLQRKLCRDEARITVVEPNSYMTYQPFLPEAAASNVEPRHVVVPLRPVLRECQVITGVVENLDHSRRIATVRPRWGRPNEISYDVLVMAIGSIPRTLPIPGLAERAIGFKSITDATWLRNRVLTALDAAASSPDPRLRRRALTFVFVGGGFAGIEALAELEDMASHAIRHYPALRRGDMRWVLVEAANRIVPEVSEDLGRYTAERLLERGIDVRLNTQVTSLADDQVVLDDGSRFAAETVVWTAGMRPHPLLEHTGLPLDDHKRLEATAFLAVDGAADAWTAGDCAAVPDLTRPGAWCAPNAQHAVRQAKVLADNVVASMRGRPLRPYRHASAGAVASLGRYQGVAEIYGVKLRGLPAWLMHRAYHISRMPTLGRKLGVLADWTFVRRNVVSLGSLAEPRQDFEAIAALQAA